MVRRDDRTKTRQHKGRGEDERSILSRRSFLVSSVVTGLGVTTGIHCGIIPEPQPCLSIKPPKTIEENIEDAETSLREQRVHLERALELTIHSRDQQWPESIQGCLHLNLSNIQELVHGSEQILSDLKIAAEHGDENRVENHTYAILGNGKKIEKYVREAEYCSEPQPCLSVIED